MAHCAAAAAAMGRHARFLLILVASAWLLTGCGRQPAPTFDDELALADGLVARGDLAAALVPLGRALRMQPENGTLRWRLGRLATRLGRYDDAEIHLRRALQLGVSPSSVLPLYAETLLGQGRYKELEALDVPADAAPDARAAVLIQQAFASLRIDRLDDARWQFDSARKLAPNTPLARLAGARMQLAEGDRAGARRTLEALLEEMPTHGRAWSLLADIARAEGRLDDADAAYGKAIEYSVASAHLYFFRAETRIDLGRVEAAAEDVATIESFAPQSFEAAYLRGRLLLLDGKPEQALALLETAARLKPFHVETLLYGGIAAYAVGRRNQAEDWLLRVLNADDDIDLARLLLGWMCVEQQRYAEAEAYLAPVYAHEPEQIRAGRALASALLGQGKSAQAVTVLESLVALPTAAADLRLHLAIALLISDQERRGLDTLQALVDEYPDYRAPYEYLIAYHVRRGDFETAFDWAERYRVRYAADTRPLQLLARAQLAHGDPEAAAELYRQALDIDAGDEPANLGLAEIAIAGGRPVQAGERYDTLLAAHPDNLPAMLGQAALAASAGDAGAAEDWLHRALVAKPGALIPRLDLAQLLYDQNRYDEARDLLQEPEAASFEDDPAYLGLLGEVLLAAGDNELAARRLRRLVTLLPESAHAHFLYSRALMALDDQLLLEDALERVLVLEPGNAVARLDLVRLHIANQRFDPALRVLAPLLAERPDHPGLMLLKGLALAGRGEPDAALASLTLAFEGRPSRRTLLALVGAEAEAGRTQDAIARLERWLAGHPEDGAVRLVLAGDYKTAGLDDEALAQYEAVLARDPDQVVALNNLAWGLLETDLPRALALARHARDLAPTDLTVAHTLACAQVAAADWRGADLTLQPALARDPSDPDLLWLSARVDFAQQRTRRAASQLEHLLDVEAEFEGREEAIELLARIQAEQEGEDATAVW